MENDKYKTLFESIKNKYDTFANADNTLDQKAGMLMGIEIAIGIGYLSFAIKDLPCIKFAESISGLILLCVSAIFLFVVNWPRKYIGISVDLSNHQEYLNKPEDKLLLQLISDAQNAATHNNKKLILKVQLYKIAIILFIISSILLILSKLGIFYV